jgi:hypothetical protein
MSAAAGAASNVAEKGWWGPRIWRILHSLAEINDRTDVGPAWRQALTLTADILPCVICRDHLRTHLRSMSFPIGVSNGPQLRRALWAIHAGTAAAGAVPFPEERLATEYGGSREEIATRVTGLISEVVTAFTSYSVLDRLHAASIGPWQRAIGQLTTLLRWPQPPPQPVGSRRRGTVRR